jgi:hypothetical protein
VGKGRPTPRTPLKASEGHIQAHVHADDAARERAKHAQACEVLGTNIDASEGRDTAGIVASTGQAHGKGGCRCRQAPLFFAASLLVKKPPRMAGFLLGMTLAWLVYSVAHRRRRQPWAQHHETVPNPINQPTPSPPWRWIFQLLEGMHRVQVTVQGQGHALIEGLNDVQIKILRVFGNEVCPLYHISTG